MILRRSPLLELAFTLADGFTYVDYAIRSGMNVDDFAPRLSFFFNSHLDFFEEIAKLADEIDLGVSGLTSDVAQSRLDLIGLNEIP